MKIQRVPKERAEKEVKTLENQKSLWQDVARRVSSLRDTARTLFSFQNPFNERISSSGDEAVITATATREAVLEERHFIVRKLATSDKFLSRPLDTAYKVPAGDYLFTVGETEISIPFRGGSIKEFSEAVGRRSKDKIRVSTLAVEQKTQSIIVESLLTGSENRLGFKKDAERLALETGLVTRVDDQERKLVLGEKTVRGAAGNAAPILSSLDEGELKVAAGGSARIALTPAVRVSGTLSIEFELKSTSLPSDTTEQESPPTGPQVPATGSVSYGGLVVESDPSTVPLPRWEAPEPPKRIDDPAVLSFIYSDGTSATLPSVRDDKGFEKFTIKLADYTGGSPGSNVSSTKELVALDLVNKNTHRDVAIRALRIFDPDSRGGLKARNPIELAGNSVLSMDGIELVRSKNEIDDLIPGVKLQLEGTSDKKVRVAIEPDREAAKEAIISMVGNYNRLFADINVLTRADSKIITELSYLSDEERKTMEERMGSLQGDMTLNQLKTTLQRAAGSPYPTSKERELTLLSQIGVSTDARKPGSATGVDASRLRGYLEIDEKLLESALKDNIDAIKELFGNDTDGDLIVDSGFAYTVDAYVKPFVETGGLLVLKSGTIDNRITQTKKQIENYDRQLISQEDDLKRKYGLMEGALNRMERTSGSIDQFNKNSSD